MGDENDKAAPTTSLLDFRRAKAARAERENQVSEVRAAARRLIFECEGLLELGGPPDRAPDPLDFALQVELVEEAIRIWKRNADPFTAPQAPKPASHLSTKGLRCPRVRRGHKPSVGDTPTPKKE